MRVDLSGSDDFARLEIGGDDDGLCLCGEVENVVLCVDLGTGPRDGHGRRGLQNGEGFEVFDDGSRDVDLPLDRACFVVKRDDEPIPSAGVCDAVQDGRRRTHSHGIGELAMLAEGPHAGGRNLGRRDPAIIEV